MTSRTEMRASVERALAHHSSTGMIHGWASPEPAHHDPSRRTKWRIDFDVFTSVEVNLPGAHGICLALRRAEMAYDNLAPPQPHGPVRVSVPVSELRDVLAILQWRAEGGVLGSSSGGKDRSRELRDSVIAGIPIARRPEVIEGYRLPPDMTEAHTEGAHEVRYLAPVLVTVENGEVTSVVVDAESLQLAPEHEEDDDDVNVAETCEWPSWSIG